MLWPKQSQAHALDQRLIQSSAFLFWTRGAQKGRSIANSKFHSRWSSPFLLSVNNSMAAGARPSNCDKPSKTVRHIRLLVLGRQEWGAIGLFSLGSRAPEKGQGKHQVGRWSSPFVSERQQFHGRWGSAIELFGLVRVRPLFSE